MRFKLQIIRGAFIAMIMLFVGSIGTIAQGDTVQLLSPYNGATLPNGPDDGSGGHTWSFDWTDAGGMYGVLGYNIVVSGPGATIALVDTVVTSSNYTYSCTGCYVAWNNLNGWTWKVRVQNSYEEWGPWSETWTFNVESGSGGTTQIGPPTVQLISPSNGATLPNAPLDGSGNLSWYFDWSDGPGSSGATAYNIQVWGPSSTIDAVDDVVTTSDYTDTCNNCYVVQANLNGWSWRVRAQDSSGTWGPWSDTWSFNVAQPSGGTSARQGEDVKFKGEITLFSCPNPGDAEQACTYHIRVDEWIAGSIKLKEELAGFFRPSDSCLGGSPKLGDAVDVFARLGPGTEYERELSCAEPTHYIKRIGLQEAPATAPKSIKDFDANGDGRLNDQEFFAIADAWISGNMDDQTFFLAMDLWISQQPISSSSTESGARIQISRTDFGERLHVEVSAKGVGSTQLTLCNLKGACFTQVGSDGSSLSISLRDDSGNRLANGVYVVIVSAIGDGGRLVFSEVRKLALLR